MWIAFGVILLWASFAVSRWQYVQMNMGGIPVDIDEKVVRECAYSYFKERFPGEDLYSDVVIRGKSNIEIFTSFPKVQEEEFFEGVEKDLSALFAEKLGYQRGFTLTFVES